MANRYVPRYVEAGQSCIRENSVADLTYASYLVAGYYLITGTHEEYMYRSDQFSLACQHHFRFGSSTEEKWWLELLWHEIVLNLYGVHQYELITSTDRLRFSREASLNRLERFFENSTFFIPTEAEMNQWTVSRPIVESLCLKIETLARHLQFQFDSYLSARELRGPKHASTIRIKGELQSLLTKLVTAIGHLPNIGDVIYEAYQQSETLLASVDICLPRPFRILPEITLCGVKFRDGPRERDATIALLYYFCILVQGLLEDPPLDSVGKIGREPFIAALAICRICASVRTAMMEQKTSFHRGLKIAMNSIMKRNLFWAGLVLSASTFYYGIVPCSSSI